MLAHEGEAKNNTSTVVQRLPLTIDFMILSSGFYLDGFLSTSNSNSRKDANTYEPLIIRFIIVTRPDSVKFIDNAFAVFAS
jgi:hypothetical protein